MVILLVLFFFFLLHNQFYWPLQVGEVQKSLYKGSTFLTHFMHFKLFTPLSITLQQLEGGKKWFAFVFSWIRPVRCGGANRLPVFVPDAAAEPASPTWRPPLDSVSSHFIGGLGEPLFALFVELLSDPIADIFFFWREGKKKKKKNLI